MAFKPVTMESMNQSVTKTLILTAMVLCGGFAILCYVQSDPSWSLWLIACCVVACIYFGIYRPKKKAHKEPEVQSILPDSAREALMAGQKPQIGSSLKLKKGEHLYWADQMRTDYYNSKPRIFYLTNERLVCLDDDFRFSHPVSSMIITINSDLIRIEHGKSKMTFRCASPEAFMAAWNLVK